MLLYVLDAQEIPQRRQHQRLAEPPRPREERDFRVRFQKIAEESRLVNVIIIPPHLGKILVADRHDQSHLVTPEPYAPL